MQIQEVDARYLELQLVRTAELIDRHQPFVVLLTHYNELLSTQHTLDYELLSNLLGVRVGLVPGSKPGTGSRVGVCRKLESARR